MDEKERDRMLTELHDAMVGKPFADPPVPGMMQNQQRMMRDLYGPEGQPQRGLMDKVESLVGFRARVIVIYGVLATLAIGAARLMELLLLHNK